MGVLKYLEKSATLSLALSVSEITHVICNTIYNVCNFTRTNMTEL